MCINCASLLCGELLGSDLAPVAATLLLLWWSYTAAFAGALRDPGTPNPHAANLTLLRPENKFGVDLVESRLRGLWPLCTTKAHDAQFCLKCLSAGGGTTGGSRKP